MFCFPSSRKSYRSPNYEKFLPEAQFLEDPPAYNRSRAASDNGAALAELRELMKERRLDAYVIPNEDEHASEIPSASEERRRFITGFKGSAGLAVVTKTSAMLFVDSRYWIAAEQQLDSRFWELKKEDPRSKAVGGFEDTLCTLPAGSVIGADSRLIPPSMYDSLSAGLSKSGSMLACTSSENLIDLCWKNKPPRPLDPIYHLGIEFTGQTSSEKISNLRRTLSEHSAESAFFSTALDDNNWLLNLRGLDTPGAPLFYSYVYVSPTEVILFIDKRKVSKEVEASLELVNIQIRDYSGVWEFLNALQTDESVDQVFVGTNASYAVVQSLGSKSCTIPSPINISKAVKNATEIQGFINCNLRDAIAMVRWYALLEDLIVRQKQLVTEYEAQELFAMYRKEENYWDRPCSYISASGPSAALPHYEAPEEGSRIISLTTPYLMDSCQQYLDGSIDTTRTVHFGTPTYEQKRAFTRVLQAHIAVDSLVFPEGTTGTTLNGIVRSRLWKDGYDFGHGPGHGIGSFGVIHESSTGLGTPFVLKEGHVITNEPGFYDEGKFGCRIESTIWVEKKQTYRAFGGDVWLGFKRATRVPIQSKLVDFSLLSAEEKKWLREHNEQCYKDLKPLLKGVDDRAYKLLGRFF